MEQHIKEESVKKEGAPLGKALTMNLRITKLTREFASQISREITVAEIIIFAAAFATLPLFDLIARAFVSLGEFARGLYAIVPAAAFALGVWHSREKRSALGIFLHSLAAVSFITIATALIPLIPGAKDTVTDAGAIAIGMPILTVLFLFAAARIPRSGASYIFGAVAAIMLFFNSATALLDVPCATAMFNNVDKADLICRSTPWLQNTLIPIAIFILGYFAFTGKDEEKVA